MIYKESILKAHSLYFLIFLKILAMIFIILYSGIGLGPDEAQYWTWSRHLDVGYYSKPPGVAWQIFLSTSLFGNTELGVRLSAVVLGSLFTYAVYRLGIKTGSSEKTSFYAALIAALTPIGIFSTFLAITDGGLLLFWTLALTELSSSIHKGKPPSYLLVGFYIALGALFKWPIYLLWLAAFAQIVFYPNIRSKNILIGVLISLLGLIPSLIWNWEHDFATFRHVSTIIQGGNDGGSSGNPLEFIGSQIGLLSPIVFVLACLGIFKWKRLSSAVRFLGAVSFAILGSFIFYSFFQKGQGNWCLFAYPSLFVFISASFEKKLWIKWGVVLSVLLVACAFAVPVIQKKSLFFIPWKFNFFRHNVGWENLKMDSEEVFFADKYQNVSILSFYSKDQRPAYFFNLLGSRKNQFSYWPGPEKSKSGFFVVIENGVDVAQKLDALEADYLEKLRHYFKKVGSPKRKTLFMANGELVKEALFFPCIGFLGELPDNPEKY